MSSPGCMCAAPTDVSRVMYGQNEVRLCCPTLCALWYYTQLSFVSQDAASLPLKSPGTLSLHSGAGEDMEYQPLIWSAIGFNSGI